MQPPTPVTRRNLKSDKSVSEAGGIGFCPWGKSPYNDVDLFGGTFLCWVWKYGQPPREAELFEAFYNVKIGCELNPSQIAIQIQ